MSSPDQPTRLLLIRHGHHDSGGRFVLHACAGLTETGIAQAKALATRLARDETLGEAVVLASNSPRSFQTAEILAETLGMPVRERTCDLCEAHPGAAEGLTTEEMVAQFGPSYDVVPGAEAIANFYSCAYLALKGIISRYQGRPILAVTHSGVIRASFAVFGEMPWRHANRAFAENTGITEWSSVRRGVISQGDGDLLWLERHNDAAHLNS